jgi:hypothetical protein
MMIAKFTIFAILVLSLATYASSPASHATAQNAVMCCDGDPGDVPPR